MKKPTLKIRRIFWTAHIVGRHLPFAQHLLNRINAAKRNPAIEYPTIGGTFYENSCYNMMDAGLTVVDAAWFERELDSDVRLHSLRRSRPLRSAPRILG